jgi:hypothetical protein
MKRILLILLLAVSPVIFPACSTPPDQRVVYVQTLKAVGESAEATVALSAHLYSTGVITAKEANQIRSLYDDSFQPAFRAAVAAAHGDLNTASSPALAQLGADLAALLTKYMNR